METIGWAYILNSVVDGQWARSPIYQCDVTGLAIPAVHDSVTAALLQSVADKLDTLHSDMVTLNATLAAFKTQEAAFGQ